jgi:multidrug efflux pump subunit AcrB
MLTGTTFNVASFMGLIMVMGIVSKNGILLLDADEKFRAAGMSPEEAMIQAGRRRLRPIIMTALAAVAGMLPLALAPGAGSQMLQPLALAVIGGDRDFDGSLSDYYPGGSLLFEPQPGPAQCRLNVC